jgi:hypothetical protein
MIKNVCGTEIKMTANQGIGNIKAHLLKILKPAL